MKTFENFTAGIARFVALLALIVLGGAGNMAYAADGDPEDGYYRFVSAATNQIVGSGLYVSAGSVYWKTVDYDDIGFIWKVTATDDGYYRLTNPMVDVSLGDDGKVTMLKQSDGSYAIKKPSANSWLHALNHGNVSVDVGSTTTFGTTSWGYNTWNMEKVEINDPLVEMGVLAKELSTKTSEAITANTTDLTPTVEMEEANNYADFFSNAGMTVEHGISWGSDGGGFKALIDGKASTFFHSSWKGDPSWSQYQDDGSVVSSSDAVKTDNAYATNYHNLGVKLVKPSDNIYIEWVERPGTYSSTPTSYDLEVSDDGDTWTTVASDQTNTSISSMGGCTAKVGPFKFDKEYQYVRIVPKSNYRRSNGISSPVKYFSFSEFRVYSLTDKLADAGTDAVTSMFNSWYTATYNTQRSDLKRAVANLDALYKQVFEGIVSADTIVKDGYYLINLPEAEDDGVCWTPIDDEGTMRLGAYSTDLSNPEPAYVWHVTRSASGKYTLKNCGEQQATYPEAITKGAYEDANVLMTGRQKQEFNISLNADGTAYVFPDGNINNLSLNYETLFMEVRNARNSKSLVEFVAVEPTDAIKLNEIISEAEGRQFEVGTNPGQVAQEDYDAFKTVLDNAIAERKSPSGNTAAVISALSDAIAALDARTNAIADGYYYIVSVKDAQQYLIPEIESGGTYIGLKTKELEAGNSAFVWHITTGADGQRAMKNCGYSDSTYIAALSAGYTQATVRMGLMSESSQTFDHMHGNAYRIYSSANTSYWDLHNGAVVTYNSFSAADNNEWALVKVPSDALPKYTSLIEAITDANAAIAATKVSSDPGGASGDLTNITAALDKAEGIYTGGGSDDEAAEAARNLAEATKEFLAQDHSQMQPVTEGYYRFISEGAAYMGNSTPAAYTKDGHLFWGPLDTSDPHFVFKITPQADGTFYVQSALYDTHFGELDTLGLVAMTAEPHAVNISSAGNMLWNFINPNDKMQYVRGGGGDELNAEFRMRATYTSEYTRKQHNWYLRRLTTEEIEQMTSTAATILVNENLKTAISRGQSAYSNAYRYDVDYSAPLITDVNADYPRDGQVWSLPRENDKSWASYSSMLKGSLRCEDPNDFDNKSGVPLQIDLKENPVQNFEIKYTVYGGSWQWRESWQDITVYATNDESVAGKDETVPAEWKTVGHYTNLPTNFGYEIGNRTFKYRVTDADSPYRFFRIIVNKTYMPQAYGRFCVYAFNIYEAIPNEAGSPYNYIEGMKSAADKLNSLISEARAKLDNGTATQDDVDALNAAAKAVEDMTPNSDQLNALINEVNDYLEDFGAGDDWGDVSVDEWQALTETIAEASNYDHDNPSISELSTLYTKLYNAFELYKSQQKRVEVGKWYRIINVESTRPGTQSQGGTADDSSGNLGFVRNLGIFATRSNKTGETLALSGYDYLTGTRADSLNVSPYAMWRLVESESGDGTYYLQNRANGLYLGQVIPTSNRGMSETPNPYKVVLLKTGQYAISSTVNNSSDYPLHGYGVGTLGSWNGITVATSKNSPSAWTFEEVNDEEIENLSVSILDNSISIMTLPYEYTEETAEINEGNGIMCYAIQGLSDNGTVLNLTQKSSFAAGEPFVCVANDYELEDTEAEPVEFALPFANSFVREAKSVNGLVGTFADVKPGVAGYGVLSQNKLRATFTSTLVAAQTGYIVTSAIVNDAAASVDLQITLPDGVVGIKGATISGKAASVNVYTADGVTVKRGVKPAEATKGLAKGIYIIGTRKVVVK